MKKLTYIALCSVLLSACSSITEGSRQEIMVYTDPPGATCVLTKHDGYNEFLGNVMSTPDSVFVEKSKYDIDVSCSKKGYQTKVFRNHSDLAAMTVGNILLGGVIGIGIDSATGSSNKYDGVVHVELLKDGE